MKGMVVYPTFHVLGPLPSHIAMGGRVQMPLGRYRFGLVEVGSVVYNCVK